MNRYIFFLFFLIQSIAGYATHIVGGEIYYDYLGNNNYKITLKVYRDCINGQAPFDNPASVGIYDANANLVTTLSIPLPAVTLLPVTLNNPCYAAPTNVCVEEAIYIQTVNLPPIAGGYFVSYQRCCRNNTILNLVNPWDVGATYMAHIPDPSIASNNSSPRYSQYPPIFLCAGLPFVFDHSATDPDGDSLVYQLCDPYEGATALNPMPVPPGPPPYLNVPFSSINGFSGSYPMSSSPPLNVNSSTGLMTGTPNTIGQWVVGVCVNEYRNGVLISTNKRDFQFNVTNCPNVTTSSIPSQQVFCSGFTTNFLNNSINANNYFWDFGDPTATNDTSNLATPTWTYSNPGTYTVTLIANPGLTCADTSQSVFQIQPLMSPSFTIPPLQCFNGNSYSFNAGGVFQGGATTTFNWTFQSANPSNSFAQNPNNVQFNSVGNHQVTLTISENGCVKTVSNIITVKPDPVAVVPPQQSFCDGFTLNLSNNSQNATIYHWDFGDASIANDTSNLPNPSWTYSSPGSYTVTLIAKDNGLNCTSTDQFVYNIQPLMQPNFTPPSAQCLTGNGFNFIAAGAFLGGAASSFSWNYQNGIPSQSTLQNPTNIAFPAAGIYAVTLTIAENGCIKSYIDSVEVNPMPIANFTFTPIEACIPVSVLFYDTLNTSLTMSNHLWSFGDGATSTLSNPSHVYNTEGVYTLSLSVTATNVFGCSIDTFFTVLNAVKANPIPSAKFFATPQTVSIFEPEITFVDSSENGINCLLDLGDGTILQNACNFDVLLHSYMEPGTYHVKQILVNGIGCTDTFELDIIIKPEFRFFVPNAFTPNNDGKNDTFFPKIMGVQDFEFRIFDRWGEQLFYTNNIYTGWDGIYKGDWCKNDVYVYQIKFRDVIEFKNQSYVGKVTLLR